MNGNTHACPSSEILLSQITVSADFDGLCDSVDGLDVSVEEVGDDVKNPLHLRIDLTFLQMSVFWY